MALSIYLLIYSSWLSFCLPTDVSRYTYIQSQMLLECTVVFSVPFLSLLLHSLNLDFLVNDTRSLLCTAQRKSIKIEEQKSSN